MDVEKSLRVLVVGIARVDSTAESFDEFSRNAEARLKSRLQPIADLETHGATTGQSDTRDLSVACVIEDTKTQYLVRHVDCRDLWVEARFWGPASVVREHCQLATAIFDSIAPTEGHQTNNQQQPSTETT